MSPWNTDDGLVSKSDAQVKIGELAVTQGINGVFKVFYDGNLVSSPDDLPDMVDMNKVGVSEVLDQAV